MLLRLPLRQLARAQRARLAIGHEENASRHWRRNTRASSVDTTTRARQASDWGRVRLEQALQSLIEVDMVLRSAGRVAPEAASVERLFIRLAMLRGR